MEKSFRKQRRPKLTYFLNDNNEIVVKKKKVQVNIISSSNTRLKAGDKIPATAYVFTEEIPLEGIVRFKDHRRLKVFFEKGTKCYNPLCSCVGTRLIAGKDNGGGIHWDVYTDSYVLMTVDHVTPQVKGGNWDINNLEPMCRFCNNKKGSKSLAEFLDSGYYPQRGF